MGFVTLRRFAPCLALAFTACGGDVPLPDAGAYAGTIEPPTAHARPMRLFVGYQRHGSSADVVVRLDGGPAARVEGVFRDGELVVRELSLASLDELSDSCNSGGAQLDVLRLRGTDDGVSAYAQGEFGQAYDWDMRTSGPLQATFAMREEARPSFAAAAPRIGPVAAWTFLASEPVSPAAAWFEVAGRRIDGVFASAEPSHRIAVSPAAPLPWGASVTAHLEFRRASGDAGSTTSEASVVTAPTGSDFDPNLRTLGACWHLESSCCPTRLPRPCSDALGEPLRQAAHTG